MENNILKTEFAVHIETTRGLICVHAEAGYSGVGYRYQPINKNDPYDFGPLTVEGGIDGFCNREEIAARLHHSWIDQTDENIDMIQRAAQLVYTLARNSERKDVTVRMVSDEFGGENFGPYTDANEAIAAVGRLTDSAEGDGVERIIGVVVNPEDEDDEGDDADV